MRKSLDDIPEMVLPDAKYPRPLPAELVPYYVYLLDCGHSIMCVLRQHLAAAQQEGMDQYEGAVPVKYVLEKGYEMIGGYVIVDADYDPAYGLKIPEGYDEF